MHHDRGQKIELVESEELVFDENVEWAVFDPDEHAKFFPESSRRLSAYRSPNGRYWAAFATRVSETIDGVREPAGICLTEGNELLYSVITDPVENAYPANNGTIITFGRDGTDFTVFNSSGEIILEEEFESIAGTMAISPNGEFAATATAFPDNAIHLYNLREQRYLGRRANPSTTVIMYLEFESTRDGYVLHTYDIHPESNLADEVDPARTEPIDRIPASPISNELELDGAGIIIEGDTWHHISTDELEKIEDDLRIPGVIVETTCEMQVEPLHADLIFDNVKSAGESDYHICSDCKPAITSYPSEKVEKTSYSP